MNEDVVERVRKTCWEAIRLQQQKGRRVRGNGRGTYQDPTRPTDVLCLMGAIGVTIDGSLTFPPRAASTILDISVDEAFALEAGFEGWREQAHFELPFYRLGQEISKALDE